MSYRSPAGYRTAFNLIVSKDSEITNLNVVNATATEISSTDIYADSIDCITGYTNILYVNDVSAKNISGDNIISQNITTTNLIVNDTISGPLIRATRGEIRDISSTTISGVSFIGTGNSLIQGDLSVNGVGRFNSLFVETDLVVAGDTIVRDDVMIVDDTSISGTLTVIEGTILRDTLSVSGASHFGSSLSVSGGTILRDTLSVSGPSHFGSSLSVSGGTILRDTLSVSGAITTSRLNTIDLSAKNIIIDTSLGIGIANPFHALDVNGAIRLYGKMNDTVPGSSQVFLPRKEYIQFAYTDVSAGTGSDYARIYCDDTGTTGPNNGVLVLEIADDPSTAADKFIIRASNKVTPPALPWNIIDIATFTSAPSQEARVGIGITSPTTTLDICGHTKIRGVPGTILPTLSLASANNVTNSIIRANLDDSINYGLQFLPNGDVVTMVCTSNGNVGIGNTAPSYALDVSGPSRLNTSSNIGITTNISGVIIGRTNVVLPNDNSVLSVKYGNTDSQDWFFSSKGGPGPGYGYWNGMLGKGMTFNKDPSRNDLKFYTDGGQVHGGGFNLENRYFDILGQHRDGLSGNIDVSYNNARLARFDLSNGNFGIGKGLITPSYTLDVSGTFELSNKNDKHRIYTEDITFTNLIFDDVTNNGKLRFVQAASSNFIQSALSTSNTTFAPLIFSKFADGTPYYKFYDGGMDISGIVKIGTFRNKGSAVVIGHNNTSILGSHTDCSGLLLQTDDTQKGYVRTRGNQGLYLGANDNNHMFIGTTGNVGIGTDTPSNTLDISGIFGVRANKPTIQTNSTGYVGIGITNPTTFLDVCGNIKIRGLPGTSLPTLTFSSASNNSISGAIRSNLDNNINYGLQFLPNGDVVTMVCTSNGNVGIGTNSPSHPLDVSGSARIIDGILYVRDTSNGGGNNINFNGIEFQNRYLSTPADPSVITRNFIRPFRRINGTADSFALNLNNNLYVNNTQIPGVGVNISSPSYSFDVSGSVRFLNSSYNPLKISGRTDDGGNNLIYLANNRYESGTNLNNRWGIGLDNSTQDNNVSSLSGSDLYIAAYGNGSYLSTPIFIKRASGNVGIQTNNPLFPLDVASSTNQSFSTNAYFDTSSSSGTAPTTTALGTKGVSIKGLQYMWATGGFVASSDRRIKTDISDLLDNECLSIIRKLKPKKYSYIDKVERGPLPVYGFIAQDIATDISYATSIHTELIPDYYSIVSPFSADSSSIEVILDKDYTISNGTDIKVVVSYLSKDGSNNDSFFNSTCLDYNSSSKHLSFNHSLPISSIDDVSAVFLYGKKVDDFHTLNKDAIWTIATAALQEIDRIQITHQNEINKLKQQPITYRGSITLSSTDLSPTTSINLDTYFSLLPGEFSTKVNPQIFLQNRSGWAQVRGSIIGDNLVIESKPVESTDIIDFMILVN
jgi:hypothetical protein